MSTNATIVSVVGIVAVCLMVVVIVRSTGSGAVLKDLGGLVAGLGRGAAAVIEAVSSLLH